jgi:hypothetical protein
MTTLGSTRTCLVCFLVFFSLGSWATDGDATGVESTEENSPADVIDLLKAVHFTTPAGQDVIIEPGRYHVTQSEGRLGLTKNESRPMVEVEATAIEHDELVALPTVTAMTEEGQEDELFLTLLLPGGQGFTATGSIGGTRSRAATRFIANMGAIRAAGARPSSLLPHLQPQANPVPASGKGKMVTWNYLRMNHPDLVAQALADVQAGKKPRGAVAGLATDTELSDLLRVNWTAEAARLKGSRPSVSPQDGVSTRAVRNTAVLSTLVKTKFLLPLSLPPQTIGSVWSGQSKTAIVTVTSPHDGYLDAELDAATTRRRFRIVRATTFTGELVQGRPVVAQEVRDQAGFVRINVRAGQQVAVEVAFEPDSIIGPPAGNYEEMLSLNGVSSTGIKWARMAAIRARCEGINFGAIVYAQQGHMITLTNQTATAPIVVTNAAATPVSGTITAAQLPAGVTMDPVPVSLGGQGNQSYVLRFHVGDNAVDGAAQPIVIRFDYAGQTRLVTLDISIYHPWMFWCGGQDCGFGLPGQTQSFWVVLDHGNHVGVHQIQLWIRDDGQWWWKIDAFNTELTGSTDFETVIKFNANTIVSDKISVHIGYRTDHQEYEHTNVHPWIHSNFLQAAEGGVTIQVFEK